MIRVRAADVLAVVPRETRIWLRTATPAFAPWAVAPVRGGELQTTERARAAQIAA